MIPIGVESVWIRDMCTTDSIEQALGVVQYKKKRESASDAAFNIIEY